MKVLLSIRPEFAFKIFNGSKRYEYRRSIFKQKTVTTILVYVSAPVQRVVGEFEIGGIIQDQPLELWARTKEYSGISKKGFLEYFSNRTQGYAILVKNPKIYVEPFRLDRLKVLSPPQSFVYLRY